jgi:hypothetical protein
MTAALDLPIAPEAVSAPTPKKRGGGPRTEEGKMASRCNSMTHGMRAKVLLPDDLVDAVAARTAEMNAQHAPANPYESWLVSEMAKAAAKLDRCDDLMTLDLERVIERAKLCWEADRRKEADALGARMQKDPGRVSRALERSRQGADWMIEKWEGLGAALRSNGGWDEAQRRLAFDLLGVDPELRHGSDKVPPEGDAAALAALVAGELESLRFVQEVSLAPLDRAEQSMAAAGMPLTEDACTARLRRYESAQRRALQWALSELRRVREGMPPSSTPGPGVDAARTEPAPARPSLGPRPVALASAVDPLVRHSQRGTLEMLMGSVPRAPEVEEAPEVEAPAVEEVPAVEAPAVSPAPAFAMTSFSASPMSGNRRDRLARKAQERRAARKASR